MVLTDFGETLLKLEQAGLIHNKLPKASEDKSRAWFHLDLNSTPCWVRVEDLMQVLRADGGMLYSVLEDNYAIATADLYPLNSEVHVVPSYTMGRDVHRVEFNELLPSLTKAATVFDTLLDDLDSVLALPENVGNHKIFRLYIADQVYAFIATPESYIRILGFLIKMDLPLSSLLKATASRDACSSPRPTFVADITGVNLWNYIQYHKKWWWKLLMFLGPENVFDLK